MSTAYPPRLVRYAFASKKERDAARASPMVAGSYGEFPDVVSLFYLKPGTDFLSQHFELGPPHHPDSTAPRQVLYAVTFHKAPGSGQVTIYSSPQQGSSPLAIGLTAKRFSNSANITLPGEAGSKNNPKTEYLKHSGFTPHQKYAFTFAGESFEWREDTSKKPTTRTLIRLSKTPAASVNVDPDESTSKAMSQDESSSKATSMDERQIVKPPAARPDVVATWTEGSVPNRKGMLGGLKFSDNGVATQLGDYFKLLVVTSALVACQYGVGIDGTWSWAQEKQLEKSNYAPSSGQT